MGGTGVGTGFGPTPVMGGFTGSSSVSGLDCGLTPCSLSRDISFTLGADDAAALVARTEVGRDAPTGDVVWTYQPAAVTGVFDCGIEGCDFLSFTASFSTSGRDAVVLVMRAEILPIGDVPVGAPASLSLIAAGLGGLGALRRRARR